MNSDFKERILKLVNDFESGDLTRNSMALFSGLGYNTNRQSSLAHPTYQEFEQVFVDGNTRFNSEKAMVWDWTYVNLLFQLSKDEIVPTLELFNTDRVDRTIMEAYLFFAIELTGDQYRRTELSQITREVNKLFLMPVMILFKTGENLTISIINRRLNQRDEARDVLEKVTLIKDIAIRNPHRAHIEILYDLSFPQLMTHYAITNFIELHKAWQKTLDIRELNRRFYQELSCWYFWARNKVSFPADQEPDEDKRNAVSLIRLITRIIFIWFIKEKNLIPEELFDTRYLSQIVKAFNQSPQSTNFYTAILQNLFFGTLNQRMEDRKFTKTGDFKVNRDEYGVKTLYRYPDQFTIPEDEVLKLFQSIPFLNGGLFDCLDKTDDSGKIIYSDGFSREPGKRAVVPDYLFFSSEQECDLNDIYGTRNKQYKVKGLLEILSGYKFTIAENTPLEEEVALDPELLGKVFENLLASFNPETRTTARKQTGSFYTPREIVEYMVDESLIAYLKSAFLDQPSTDSIKSHFQLNMFDELLGSDNLAMDNRSPGLSWQGREEELEFQLHELVSYTTEFHRFNPVEVDILIRAIDHCKILDPACGSGAFPMGILHKLVLILHKIDPNNEKWELRQIQNAKQIDDSVIRERVIADIEEAFRNNDLDYGRKLFLIENCIYGVDIQPIAVQIAKLRVFISLIIDQNKKPDKENQGIRSLPNLETKFVAADTLIALEKQYDEKGGEAIFRHDAKVKQLEEKLREIRHDYFSAKTRSEKKRYQEQDKKTREAIAGELASLKYSEHDIDSIKNYDPYDQNRGAGFFDLGWMFGFKPGMGFDIVIGNPPYIQIQNFSGMQQQLDWEKQRYETYVRTGDVYCLFYERGYRLLKNGGILAYITSNKWMRANYGKTLRKFLSQKTDPRILIDFGGYQVFESATVDTCIMIFRKAVVKDYVLKACMIDKQDLNKSSLSEFLNGNSSIINDMGENSWIISSNEEYQIRKQIEMVGIPLKDWNIKINYGIKTGLNEAFIINGKMKDELIRQDPKSAEILKPILRGRDIKRYKAEFADLWLISTLPVLNLEIDHYPAIKNYLKSFGKKLEQIGEEYVDGEGVKQKTRKATSNRWFELQDTIAYYQEFEKEKIVWQELSRTGSSFAYTPDKLFVNNSGYIMTGKSLYYLCAVLNSRLIMYYFDAINQKLDITGWRWLNQYVEKLPIPAIEIPSQLPFSILVDCILFCKVHSMESESSLLESVIDGLVYDLYFPEEMKAAHCYITQRISEVVRPFKPDDTDAFKATYISELCRFFNQDDTVYHGLIHRRTVLPVRIITGEKNDG